MTYNVDIVMCIDCTGSMKKLLNMVKENALNFYPNLVERCKEKDKHISGLRVRVIAFRDFVADGKHAISDSGFLHIPNQEMEFKEFVNQLNPKGGGDEPENGLEALAMAIKSNWTNDGDKNRHVIVVWTDASTHPLERAESRTPYYPPNMPKDLNELTDLWEDCQYMDDSAKRLVLFAPDAYAWSAIGNDWTNTMHHPAKAGEGLEDVDYELILSNIVNSI